MFAIFVSGSCHFQLRSLLQLLLLSRMPPLLTRKVVLAARALAPAPTLASLASLPTPLHVLPAPATPLAAAAPLAAQLAVLTLGKSAVAAAAPVGQGGINGGCPTPQPMRRRP